MSSPESTMAKCSSCGAPMESSTSQICPKCLLGIGMMTQIDRPLEPGAMFHGLEIVSMLGRGGMGIVYKARQPALERFVAIKILPRALGQKPELTQRFSLEAKALASLQHPNIVAVHDFGKEGDQFFFVMEFVDGTNLRPLLRSGDLKAPEALKIIPTICEALAYAHSHGVIHRDVKPENILIDKLGRVKIADFGLAKILSEHPTPSMTQTDVAMGTPHYMAPEQFESAKSVDHRADIYSIGVLFYEMLTGELPLGRFDPPSQKRGEVDVRLDEIVMRALDKDPAKRYQSMEDVGRDVTRITGISASGQAAPPGPSKQSYVLMALGALLVLGGIIWGVLQFNQTPPPQSSRVDYQKLYEAEKKRAAELAAVEIKKPEVKEVKVDPWSAAKLDDAAMPEGWRVGDVIEATERAEVHKYLSWITSEAEGIEKVRKLVFNGPNDYSVSVFVYQCRTAQVLDKCVDILHQRVLGLPNHFAIDKDNTLVYGLAFQNTYDTRDGIITPAVETIEDALRTKFGLPSATRDDPSALKQGQFPKDWKEIRSELVKKPADLPKLLAGFQPPLKPPAKDFRDGWVRSYGNPSTPGDSVEIFSFRFFEFEPCKEYRQALRSYDPAGGQGFVVLQEHDRTVAVFYALKDGATSPAIAEYLKHLATSMRTTLDHFDLVVTAGAAKKDDKSLKIPMEFHGINSREIRKGGVWSVKVWNFETKEHEEPVEVQVPVTFEHIDGKMTTIFSIPLDAVRVGFHVKDDGTSHLSFHIDWGEKYLDGKDFDVSVNN